MGFVGEGGRDDEQRERESREMVKQETEIRKKKKKRKWAPLNKKIIYDLQLVNSTVSNMRLHCSSIAKIIPFKTIDGASFWVKNAKKKRFLAFERFDKNALSSQFTFSKMFFFP